MAEEITPGIREWRRLYESAVRIKEISPWEWMTETDVFGVQSPESGELGFVSVMGLLGEHYAVSLYLGSEGIHGFLDLQEMGPFADPGALIQIPQIQASFENREELDKRDREVIEELGLKFRGRNAWPMFRSYRPSLFPMVLGCRRGPLSVVGAGAVGRRGATLQGGLFFAGAFRRRELPASCLPPGREEASLGRRFDGCAST